MKIKVFRYILYVVCALCTLSCADDSMPSGGQLADVPYYLAVDRDNINFIANPLTIMDKDMAQTLAVTSTNVPWEIIGAPYWLSLSTANGTGDAVIKVAAGVNSQVDSSRVAVLHLVSLAEAYSYSKEITVTQNAARAYLRVNESSLSFAPQAATATVTVDANIEWEAVTEAAWLALSTNNSGELQISASENLTDSARTATVVLHRTGTTVALATVNITQSEGGVTGSTDELKFGIEGGTCSVDITADVSWTAVSSAPSWLSVTPESGKGGNNIRLAISVLANNTVNGRNGFVYVKIGTEQKLSIPVSQESVFFNVEGDLQNFAADGNETQKLKVVANKEWTVLSSPEWLTVTPAQGGKGTAEISLKAAENRSLNSRSATLRVGIENLGVYKDIAIVQNGFESDFAGTELNFGWGASQREIDILVPGSWSAMVSDEWLSLSQYSGSGGEKVIVTVQANDAEDARTGTVSIVSEDRTFVFSVVQQGQYLKISSTAGEVAAMGGSVNLNVNTTVGAKDSIEYEGTVADWLTVSSDGEGGYTLTAAYNPSINPRAAQFVIMPAMNTTNSTCAQGVKFAVTQKGRALSAGTDRIDMFKAGGTSDTYIIAADGRYSISKPDADNWYVLQHDSVSSVFKIAVSENATGRERKSQLEIALDELPEGEEKLIVVEIAQLAKNASINIGGYGEDTDWSVTTGTLNGHDWVNLGLPSGTLWATCNVGAGAPEECGNYYAWGETAVKENYTQENSTAYGKVMDDIGGNARYDVARAEWGDVWRMPTYEELQELVDNCVWEWMTQNGMKGYRVTGKNGNSIFLPAAGWRSGVVQYYKGVNGIYWCSTPYVGSNYGNAYRMDFGNGYQRTSHSARYDGISVRPVCE